jgi:hypothetical protein
MPSDNFTRANSGTLGANWTDIVAGWGIVSNQASKTQTGTVCTSKYSASSPSGNDMRSEVTYVAASLGSAYQPGCCVRLTGTGAGDQSAYWLFLNTDGATADKGWQIQKLNSFTTILSGSDVLTNGQIWGIQCIGTTIAATLAGVIVNSVTDSSIASGTWGIMGFDAGQTDLLAGWTGTDLSGASPIFLGQACL